jgi:hypothetical protein
MHIYLTLRFVPANSIMTQNKIKYSNDRMNEFRYFRATKKKKKKTKKKEQEFRYLVAFCELLFSAKNVMIHLLTFAIFLLL